MKHIVFSVVFIAASLVCILVCIVLKRKKITSSVPASLKYIGDLIIYFTLALACVTFVTGILLLFFSALTEVLALTYMFSLTAALIVLILHMNAVLKRQRKNTGENTGI